EVHADVDAATLAGQRERHFAFGHPGGGRRIAGARVRAAGNVVAEHVADVAHAGDLAVAVVDGRLAEREAAAFGPELDFHRLPIRARHGAFAARRLVEHRPTG